MTANWELREFLVRLIEESYGYPFDDITVAEVDRWVKRHARNTEGEFMPLHYDAVMDVLT